MRSDLEPTGCFPFEPEQARSLQWLPLSVRYKLDECGLRLSLAQWQTLPLAERSDLVRIPPGSTFVLRATQAAASRDTRTRESVHPQVEELVQVLECDVATARAWLAAATPFALYVFGKVFRTQLNRQAVSS